MTTRRERRLASQRALPLKVVRAAARHVVALVLFTLPAVALWWHVWTGHPSSTLTCACGDPAQEVWFMAWPAWAIAHGANVFFAGMVNVPHGANLLSNTSGTLVGIVLSPVTWLWGPVSATNLALTLAPGLSAWGCWIALRRFVTWQPGAVVASLVYGYSAAVVTSLIFGHVSVTVLVIPPLLFVTLYETLVTQARSPRRDGVLLAALVLVQFLISPEVLVMCVLFAAVGLVIAIVVGWRQVRRRAEHAARALGLGVGISVVVLAYPAWFGFAGPQSVRGVLFAFTGFAGVPLSGFFAPGPYGSFSTYVRFGGYTGRLGPTPDYLGAGVGAWVVLALAAARRRLLVWCLFVLALVAAWLSLGQFLLGAPHAWEHSWLPWRYLSELPVLKEILADQMAPFITLFLAFVLAIGLDAGIDHLRRLGSWGPQQVRAVAAAITAVLAVAALVPVFVTYDMPFRVVSTALPAFMRVDAPKLPTGSVVLTVPFAVSGSTEPMLWQATDDMHFKLAGAALKTPNAKGGPVGQGGPGSARRILTDLTVVGNQQPLGTATQVATVRAAIRSWHVNEVVIDGVSRDPIYSSGLLTEAMGTAPRYVHSAWVWKVPKGGIHAPAALGASLYLCRLAAPPIARVATDPMSMPECVLKAAALRRRHGTYP